MLRVMSIPTTDEKDFVQWWYGTLERGHMNSTSLIYIYEKPIITDSMVSMRLACPSLSSVSISVLIRRKVNGVPLFVGRLSDGRFLFAQNDFIVIAPTCGPPLDAPFRKQSHNSDIGTTRMALTAEAHVALMTNGCIGFKSDVVLKFVDIVNILSPKKEIHSLLNLSLGNQKIGLLTFFNVIPRNQSLLIRSCWTLSSAQCV